MYIKRLALKNYRNIESLNIELGKLTNIFYGKNAQGKTNILESVYMCAAGRSHRTRSDRDVIRFERNNAFVQLYVDNDGYENKIDITLRRNAKKGIAVNNIAIGRLNELFGVVTVVMFSPEDMNIIKDGPSARRHFIDMELCQQNAVYYHNLQQYNKILINRNNLLKQIPKKPELRETLFVWDSQLCTYAEKIVNERERFIALLSEKAAEIHYGISGHTEQLRLEYKTIDRQNFAKKLESNIERDIYLGSTSYGPHKDDVIFFINNINARDFGSQGQQRSAVLSCKLAEIEIIKNEKNVKPVLLLDDVLSELDKTRQQYLVNSAFGLQTIITCTGLEDSIVNLAQKCPVFYVEDGKIIKKH